MADKNHFEICMNYETMNLLKESRGPQVDLDSLFGSMKNVRAILVGQDGYPDVEKRTGMAFSYPPGTKASGSVKWIIEAAYKGSGEHREYEELPGHLGPWRDQGLLLVNSDTPGLKSFLRDVKVPAILLGKEAQKLADHFPVTFQWYHPSRKSTLNNDPADSRHWFHCTCFMDLNNYLVSNGQVPFVWDSLENRNSLYIFTDGGSSAMYGVGAAAYSVFSSSKTYLGSWSHYSRKYKTNNVAEQMAILECLRVFKDYGYKITVISDSELAIKAVDGRYRSWERLGTLDKHKNVELIRNCVLLAETMNVSFVHVPGHSTKKGLIPKDPREAFYFYGNEFVDSLCSCESPQVIAQRLPKDEYMNKRN